MRHFISVVSSPASANTVIPSMWGGGDDGAGGLDTVYGIRG